MAYTNLLPNSAVGQLSAEKTAAKHHSATNSPLIHRRLSNVKIPRLEAIKGFIAREWPHAFCFMAPGGFQRYADVVNFKPANGGINPYYVHESILRIIEHNAEEIRRDVSKPGKRRYVMFGAGEGEAEGKFLNGVNPRDVDIVVFDVSGESKPGFIKSMEKAGIPERQIRFYKRDCMDFNSKGVWEREFWETHVRAEHDNTPVRMLAFNFLMNSPFSEMEEFEEHRRLVMRPGDDAFETHDCTNGNKKENKQHITLAYGGVAEGQIIQDGISPGVLPFGPWFNDTTFMHICRDVIGLRKLDPSNFTYAPEFRTEQHGVLDVRGKTIVSLYHPPISITANLMNFLNGPAHEYQKDFLEAVKHFGGKGYVQLHSRRLPPEIVDQKLYKKKGHQVVSQYGERVDAPVRSPPGINQILFKTEPMFN